MPGRYEYDKIAAAIEYVRGHQKNTLYQNDLAARTHMSPEQIDQLFVDWAGVSFNRFFQLLSSDHIKETLNGFHEATLFDSVSSAASGKEQPAHSRFTSIIRMDEDDWNGLAEDPGIHYSFSESPFGKVLIASTSKGVCYMAFYDDQERAVQLMKDKFPQALFYLLEDKFQQDALSVFRDDWSDMPQIKLHLRGTDFQLEVWKILLDVPLGTLTTYSKMAGQIGKPRAFRATGSAIARNLIAYILPCHRVVQSAGSIGQYMWGSTRKNAIIGWETARLLKKEPLTPLLISGSSPSDL